MNDSQIKKPGIEQFASDAGTEKPDPKDDKIAELETKVGDLENKLYEERFVWVLVTIILINFLLFPRLNNWTGPLVIGLFELIGLYVLAERCRVDAIVPLIDRIGGAVKNFKGNGEQ